VDLRRHGILVAVAGLVILAANVVDAANRGGSRLNAVVIAVGAGLLFYGFTLVGRSSR